MMRKRTVGAVMVLLFAWPLIAALGVEVLAGDGPGGFPLPRDAKAAGEAPGGGGKNLVYEVARGRDAVVSEMRQLLKKDGWKITSDEKSPRGSVRLTVTKGGTTIKASVAGEGEKSGIILTLP